MKSEAASLTSPRPTSLKRSSGKFSLSSPEKAATESSSISKSGCNDLLQKKVFNFFDENGDGKITAAELQSCIRMVGGGQLSTADAEAAVQSSDVNGDGVLDFDEFQKLMEGSSSSANANQDEKNSELRDAFAFYVMEGSNNITPASLKRMLSRLGDSKSIDDCKTMIKPFDLNGDGVLSFEEFSMMMH